MKELGKRVASGILGIFILVFIVNKGGYYLSFATLIISLIGLNEFYDAIRKLNKKPISLIGYLATLLFFGIQSSLIDFDFLFTALIITSLITFLFNKNLTFEDVALTILGVLYIPFLLFHISFLDNTKYIWLVFIISFGTDTFAYFVGTSIGKKRLCPEISPKKSVEGAIGGVLGSIFLTFIYAKFAGLDSIEKLIILSIIASIVSQFGDLIASKLKRSIGIKDYGNLIPGHGGVLDRFDSIILAAPVIYYYVYYILI